MIIARIVGAYLRFKSRWFEQHPAINICQHLAQARKVLIYMPRKVEQFGAALKSLERLRKLRPAWRITVINKMEMVNFIDTKLKVEILPYSSDDINFAGMPKAQIKQLIQKSEFDLALDLTLKFDLFVIALFNLSSAPIKVCFENSEKSPFHNVEIRVNPAESLTNKYNAMVKYINMIAGAVEPRDSLRETSPGIK
ncbi:MAG: hypothetical protein ACE5IY_20820 [bacterium]